MDAFIRSKPLLGVNFIEQLKNKKIAVFGLGGVGSFVCETLARSGIGNFILVDNDTINETNLNRQLYALTSTIGCLKVDVAEERIKDINPSVNIEKYPLFVLNDTIDKIDLSNVDYVVDAIDTVTAKLLLIEKAKELNIPIISSMGTGNKLNPSDFVITDISKTSVCPLAKVMRYELRKRNIKGVKVLYSKEEPIKASVDEENLRTPCSVSFVPSVAGIMIAREIILDLKKVYQE